MDSDFHHQHTMNSGLTRYRSAPSSYFSNLINSGVYGDDDTDPFFNNPRVSNPETDQIFSSFISSAAGSSGSGGGDGGGGGGLTSDQIMNQIGGFEKQLMDVIKQEQDGVFFQEQFQPGHNINTRPVSEPMDLGTSLLRQSSSPAGFFSHLDLDNGYPLMRSMDDFGAKRLKNEAGFSSGARLSSGLLPRIPENNEAKVMEVKDEVNEGGFGSSSWDDSDILSDSFLKEFGESDQNKLSSLNSSEYQRNDVVRSRAPTSLVHHMSLPARTAELDKLLQCQDTVPLKSRAKRGCATHPRSIAERVRRSRISERMKKLQDLVPNMDKQTNTADMLDLAVDYIKELQKEAETLSEHHAKCTCPHKQKLSQTKI